MTLLDRVEEACVSGGACAEVDVMGSLLRHVRDLLNTRIGSAAAQMELGTPPPNELMRGDRPLIERMQRSIGAAIERYEPRLAAVRVTLESADIDAFMLRFRVRARLAASGDEVTFRALVDPAGRLAVRP